MKPIRIIVAGASGRMGQTIIKKIISNKSFKLIGATEGPGNKFLGSDVSKIIKSKKLVYILLMTLSHYLLKLMLLLILLCQKLH